MVLGRGGIAARGETPRDPQHSIGSVSIREIRAIRGQIRSSTKRSPKTSSAWPTSGTEEPRTARLTRIRRRTCFCPGFTVQVQRNIGQVLLRGRSPGDHAALLKLRRERPDIPRLRSEARSGLAYGLDGEARPSSSAANNHSGSSSAAASRRRRPSRITSLALL